VRARGFVRGEVNQPFDLFGGRGETLALLAREGFPDGFGVARGALVQSFEE